MMTSPCWPSSESLIGESASRKIRAVYRRNRMEGAAAGAVSVEAIFRTTKTRPVKYGCLLAADFRQKKR